MKKLFTAFIISILSGAFLFSQIPVEGLVLYLPFNYDADDYSGNENNGITHEINYLRSARGITAYFSPKSYAEIKDTNSLDFSAVTGLTIATWIRQEQDVSGYIAVKMGTGGRGDDEFKLAVSADGTINSGIVSPTTLHLLDSNGKLFLNQWTFILLRWSQADGTMKIYIDGEMNSLTYSNITSIQNTSTPLRIGQFVDAYENSFRGSLDDLRIYNRPLSEDEILALYENKVVTSNRVPGIMDVAVYPNPVQSELHVDLPGISEQAEYAISDASGRTILQGKLYSDANTIDLSAIKPGVYSFQITGGTQIFSGKIVKE